MRLEELKGIEFLTVYRNDTVVGRLTRTEGGSEFSYDSDYLASTSNGAQAIAFSLPLNPTPVAVTGDNVPPFFAGLLPEGARLGALVRSLKTSPSDMFTMLAATGDDCIGDISVSPEPLRALLQEPSIIREPATLDAVSFEELFERSIAAEDLSWRQQDPGFPGMFPKLSSQVFSFPVRLRRARYILKLGVPNYPQLIRNEHFFMRMAHSCKIVTAKTTIVTDTNNREGLLVTRFDRRYSPALGRFEKIHQEDACQFLNRYPHDKYRLSLRAVMEGVAHYATAPRIELLRLLEVIAFSYVIGNGDHHAKNISLLRLDGRIILSPAYDILSTLPYGDTHMALKMDGRDAHLRRRHFVEFGGRYDIPSRSIEQMLDRLIRRITPWVPRVSEIGFEERIQQRLEKEMIGRMGALSEGK